LQNSTYKRSPSSSDNIALASSFADFFTSKIGKIHHGLVETGKYALGLPLQTSQFAVQSFATLLRLPRRK